MAYSIADKMEWTLIFVAEFGRRFGLTLKQAFNYLSRFGGIKKPGADHQQDEKQGLQGEGNHVNYWPHSGGN